MRISNIGSAQIEIFAALAESGGFSEAAHRLGLTQSAVSHGLARLETELGIVLVERGRRGVVLTAAGCAVLPQAREVLARLEAVRQAAMAARGAAMGKMRLGITPMLLPPRLLAGLTARFRGQYPDVELILMDGVGREIEEWLGEGLIDVGVVTAPSVSGIEVRPLFSDELCVLMSEEHPLRDRDAIETSDIAAYPLLIPRFGRQLQTELLQRRRPDDAGDEGRPPVRHFISDLPTLSEMVRRGVGITLLPRLALPEETSGLLTRSLAPPLPLRIGLGVARPWDSVSPVVRLLADSAEIWAKETGLP